MTPCPHFLRGRSLSILAGEMGADPVAAATELLEVVDTPSLAAQPVLPLLWYCEWAHK